MASVLEQLIIELKADDSKLRSELSKIIAEARRAGDGVATGLTPGREALKRMSDEARAGLRPLSQYRDELKRQADELKALAESQDRNSAEYRQAVSELASVRTELVSVNTELKNQKDAFDRLGQSMTRTGGALTLAVTAPLVAVGAQALKTSADFETSMNRVRALSGAVGTDFDKLRNQARDLGATTVFSASDAANAMGFLAMAGFEVEQIYASMPDTLNLAAAAQLDMGSAADIVSNILTGFGLPVNQLSGAVDVLTKAFVSSNTDLTQLGDGMKYVGPIASGLGVSFEEATAALGGLSNAGIQGGMAGTSLRMILGTLASQADKLGISTTDAAGNLRPLADLIDELNERGLTTADTLEIFGQRGGPAMSALLSQGGAALRDFTAELENSGGVADEIARVQMEGFAGQLKELESVVEELMLSLGDAGLLRVATAAAGGLRDLTTQLNEMTPEAKTTALVLGGIAVAAGPTLVILGQLVVAAGRVRTAFVALRAVALAMSGPAGWITLGVIAISALTIKMAGRRDSLAETSKQATEALEGIRTKAHDTHAAFDTLKAATDEQGLTGAVQMMAATLEGEAKDAFVTLADQAIKSGGDIEDIGQGIMQIYAEMRQESLEAKVAQLKDLRDVAEATKNALEPAFLRQASDQAYVAGLRDELARERADYERNYGSWDVPLEQQAPSVQQGAQTSLNRIADLENRIAEQTRRLDGAGDEFLTAAASLTNATIAYNTAEAELNQLTAFIRGEVDSPLLSLQTYGPTVTAPHRDGAEPPPPTPRPNPTVDSVTEVEEASIRTAKTAKELFEVIASTGSRVDQDVQRLGNTTDLQLQGLEAKAGLFREALARAWDLEDVTEDEFDYLERRLDELLAQAAELQRIAPANLRFQRQPDEGEAVYSRAAWQAWHGGETGMERALRERREAAIPPRPEEGTTVYQPDSPLSFTVERKMLPILAEMDDAWAGIVDRAHYLGETVDWSAERVRVLNQAIWAGREEGLSREHLGDLIAERDLVQQGIDAGVTFGENMGRTVAGVLGQIVDFTQAVGAGELSLISKPYEGGKAGASESLYFAELAEQAERLMAIPQDPLDDLRGRLIGIAEGAGPAAEQARILIEQLDNFKGSQDAITAHTDRVKAFEDAVAEANEILGLTPDRTTAAIDHLSALADQFEDGTDKGGLMARALRELIEELQELKDETADVESDLSKVATGLANVNNFATGLASSFTRSAAQVAEGLKLITEIDEELTPEEATQQKMQGIATIINGITTAVEGLKQAARGGMSGNDIIGLVGGIGSVAAEVIGTLTGIPGLGQVVTASFGLLNSVIGDLSNGIAEVDAQVQGLTRSSSYMGERLTQTFKERFTRQVSRGGIAGSFGATKAELDEEAFTAAMTLAESFGSMLEQALRSGDFDSGWNDAILDAMIKAFTMSDEIEQLILDMVDFWNEAWADGTWSASEDAEWRRMQEDYRRRGEKERQRYVDAGLIDDDDDTDKTRRNRRTGGSRITDLTGPARDHFSDLLAPLAHMGAQLSTLQEIRNILDSRLSRGGPGGAGGPGWANYGPITVQSSARTADELMRDIARKLQLQKRGG